MIARPSVLLLTITFSAARLCAGPYAPAAGVPGSTALPGNDPAIVAWATGWQDYIEGDDLAENFRTPDKALGPAVVPGAGDVFDIVSLGEGGRITLTFDLPISDGPGADFAVFENSVIPGFLELAFVEVSSDGAHFVRFPSHSLTPAPMGPWANLMDPTKVDGLAGKYLLGYGTPFDLADLPEDPRLDRHDIRFVRLHDIPGDGRAQDSFGNPIYDPYPTQQSAGFDLDAVAVLHQRAVAVAPVAARLAWGGDALGMRWPATPGRRYRVEHAADLQSWKTFAEAVAESEEGQVPLPPTGAEGFYRVWLLAD
jgi:hypothetical protein